MDDPTDPLLQRSSAELWPQILTLDLLVIASEHSAADLAEDPVPLEFDRTLVMRSGDQAPVAVSSVYPLTQFPVPGATVPCGFLTWVGTHPGHRRRGHLRRMITQQLADCRAQGEAISALYASEMSIYGRFGYGLAARSVKLTIPRGASLRPVAGSDALEVEIAPWDATQHGQLIADLHAEYGQGSAPGLNRPGWATGETAGMRSMREADHPRSRGGKEPLLCFVVRDAGRPVGYALARRASVWEDRGAAGQVNVREAVALTPAAAHRLWSTLLDLDLMATVTVELLPTDDPIMGLLVDPRAALPILQDNLFVRIVDLPTALAQRRYPTAVDVVLQVSDDLLADNAGRWRVRADAWGQAEVSRTEDPAQLSLDIRELGAIHLGSISLSALVQAGQVQLHDPQVLAPAAAAWSWPVAAGANWMF